MLRPLQDGDVCAKALKEIRKARIGLNEALYKLIWPYGESNLCATRRTNVTGPNKQGAPAMSQAQPQSKKTLTLLGIETSCDETAAAVVRRHDDGSGDILSNQILSQVEDHAPYGGVVPELAARAHIRHLDGLVRGALSDANLTFNDIDGIAATSGPGLIGGVIVGLLEAKGMALAAQCPLIAVNHLEGHALTARLTDSVSFPYLLLLVSGGHSQLLLVEGLGRYEKLGGTIDDAVGEAFDKTAKLMGLGFPGGPALEQTAKGGDSTRYTLPHPMKGREGYDLSFSGLKTAVRTHLVKELAINGHLSDQVKADMAAAFQETVGNVLANRIGKAMEHVKDRLGATPQLVVAGGVAANQALRARLNTLTEELGYTLIVPPPKLCTDNAVMIAWAGAERLHAGQQDPLNTAPRARWPLADLTL